MNGYEGLDNSIVFDYAKQVVKLEKVDDWLLSKAYIIIARNEFALGNYAKSKFTFEKVIGLSNYDQGAEAKYYLAYLTYLDENFVLAEQLIFALAEDYSNDYFIAKAFILLSIFWFLNQLNLNSVSFRISIFWGDNNEFVFFSGDSLRFDPGSIVYCINDKCDFSSDSLFLPICSIE